jgi:hypothetical protein
MPNDDAPVAEPMPWPGYEAARPGASLLPWSWALERLERTRRYWLATAGSEGTPHLAALWGVWVSGGLAFSTGGRTRKARNLAVRPRCTVSTESGGEAVVVDAVAEVVTGDADLVARIDAAYVAKYGGSVLGFQDSPLYWLRPLSAHGLVDSAPLVAPTRWRF